MNKVYCVYIITGQSNRVLYTGVTSNIQIRIYQRKNKSIEGFSKRYNLNRLIYYEVFEDVQEAIAREKQIKKYKRDKKDKLINDFNPTRKDLYNEL